MQFYKSKIIFFISKKKRTVNDLNQLILNNVTESNKYKFKFIHQKMKKETHQDEQTRLHQSMNFPFNGGHTK